ncbi:hypothetical protein EXS71_04200 [Candidatus Uhrbacteria bacterium]|nr:hypothetical protein [Candidatus Uhrbacteria bacterium]
MNAQNDDLDFSLAITGWKVLCLEAHTNQSRAELVWQPTQDLLNEMALNATLPITCFAGKYYMFPDDSDGAVVNLFFLGVNRKVAYLGTMFDATAYRLDKILEISRLSLINPSLAQRLGETNSETIVRDAHFCKIPVSTDLDDLATATLAVRRYLTVRAPKLASYDINWLPHQEGIRLESHIRTEAEKVATRPSFRDRLLATAQDELETLV